MSRPFDTTSTLASSLARITGLRSGSTMIPLATFTVLVWAATNVRPTTESRSGRVGGIWQHDMFTGPHRLKPGRLRVLGHPDHHFRVCAGTVVDREQTDLHHRDATTRHAERSSHLWWRHAPVRGTACQGGRQLDQLGQYGRRHAGLVPALVHPGNVWLAEETTGHLGHEKHDPAGPGSGW